MRGKVVEYVVNDVEDEDELTELLDALEDDELVVDELLVDELLLTDDVLEFTDERLDKLDELLDNEELVLLDVALDDAIDVDDMLLDVELIALLDDELEGCDETSDELLLVFPAALEELTAAGEPPVHAVVMAAIAAIHAMPSINRSLCMLIVIITRLIGWGVLESAALDKSFCTYIGIGFWRAASKDQSSLWSDRCRRSAA